MKLNEIEVDKQWTALRAGTLPCAACGLAVTVAAASEVEILEVAIGTVKFVDEGGIAREVSDTTELATTLCEQCAQIRATAAELVSANGGVRAAIGSPDIARWRIELALSALDCLGVTDYRVIDKLTAGPGAILRLITFMAEAGGRARWASHARARRTKAAGMPASSERWGHLTAEQRIVLNAARVEMFVRDRERPVAVLCPSDDGGPSGCLLCGVEAVSELPSVVRERGVWVEMEADSEVIGGRITSEPIEGYVCPMCDKAIDSAGALGRRAIGLSIRAALAVPDAVYLATLGEDFYESIGVIPAWAVTNRKPNATPWAHVDLSPVRAELEAIGLERNGLFFGDAPSLIRTA